jgi:hypothetical protein
LFRSRICTFMPLRIQVLHTYLLYCTVLVPVPVRYRYRYV